jgi:hypothetical protein
MYRVTDRGCSFSDGPNKSVRVSKPQQTQSLGSFSDAGTRCRTIAATNLEIGTTAAFEKSVSQTHHTYFRSLSPSIPRALPSAPETQPLEGASYVTPEKSRKQEIQICLCIRLALPLIPSQKELTMAEAIEQFVILAKTAKGRACTALIQQILGDKRVFVFGEILAAPSVQEASGCGHLGLSWLCSCSMR